MVGQSFKHRSLVDLVDPAVQSALNFTTVLVRYIMEHPHSLDNRELWAMRFVIEVCRVPSFGVVK